MMFQFQDHLFSLMMTVKKTDLMILDKKKEKQKLKEDQD
jgi:hypothetical protein